ncbi:MAG: acyl-CoA dehydrogenase C-terminal domain-containing protein [Betaproteobacteria bacterium]|nr:acyl-CoA dehydrogenase C-terminal domain-containing protein [Betaproteobacteria bacterium]
MSYQAPVKDMLFIMRELAGLASVRSLPGFEDATDDTVEAVLNESARFNAEVLAPLNWTGDLQPSSVADGVVTTTPGFRDAFRGFAEAGWQGVQHPAAFGGQNLPKLVATACIEMLNSANLSFALCPLLTDGAIEALLTAGSPEQQQRFIPRMIAGDWTGTMNLTEPQAGSDLSQVRSRAEPQPDGTYRIFGQKIYITYGEHDMAENIVHLVLARTPGAPEGVKGISLFIVPKFLVGDDGSLGARNDVYCASVEHKLGIKASPTAVLLYGDGKFPLASPGGGPAAAGAVGWLVGQENRGLEYMFVMMNAARFAVGMQGVAVAERAYQKAVQYARDRVQSRAVEGSSGPVAIIAHPDVRRMLMTMRALTEGARALGYVAAAAYDAAHASPDADTRKANAAFYEFLVPIVKGFSTEMSLEVTSLGVQVHGGMGFIEETGAAQHYRDARILPIYEGTTAIQANDLIGRKTVRDGGQTVRGVLGRVAQTLAELPEDGELGGIRRRLAEGAQALGDAADYLVSQGKADPRATYAGSVPYLMLCGTVLAGWQMARAALRASQQLAAGADDADFLRAKIGTARFYADHVLSRSLSLRAAIVDGASGTLALEESMF